MRQLALSRTCSGLHLVQRIAKPCLRLSLPTAVALLLATANLAVAQEENPGENHHRPRPAIEVSGEGEVRAASDTVSITVGVVSEAESAKQALTANNQAMQQLFDVLNQQQIAEKDRQTVRFDVSPQYRHEPPQPQVPQNAAPAQPRIVGYQVTNEVRVKVRDVSKVGNVLDAVVSAGSNRIFGIEFSVEDRDKLMDEARRRAVRRAREKAELLAEAAGVSVGNVITISEQHRSQPMPQQQFRMAEAQSVPIAAGEQTLTAQVQVTFELKAESK